MNNPTVECNKLKWEEVVSKLNNIKNIPLEGFYRYSNSDKEIYLKNTIIPEFDMSDKSFLYEAAFYIKGKASISIKQYNDFWLWKKVDWNDCQPDNSSVDATCYVQIAGENRRLKFHTHYNLVQNGEFEVLQPSWNAFVGFLNEKEN